MYTHKPHQIKCRKKQQRTVVDDINKQLLTKLKLRQLKNSQATIQWFKSMENKTRLQFMQIDIVDYYPSITLELFTEVMEFAKSHVSIDDLTMDIILNARKSILSHENSTWAKTSGYFDMTIGAFDGAEVTDLVGIYILYYLLTYLILEMLFST